MVGEPGRHSTRLALRAYKEYLLRVAGAAGVGLLALGALRLAATWSWWALGAAVPLAAGAWVLADRAAPYRAKSARQERGAAAERATAAALRRHKVTLVVNGADLGAGGDADHVVAHLRSQSTGVVAVVETKAGGGPVRASGRVLLSGKSGRPIPGDPVRQVQRQAQALRSLRGQPVAAIVCIPHMTSAPFTLDGTVVCSAGDLGGFLTSRLPATGLTHRDITALSQLPLKA